MRHRFAAVTTELLDDVPQLAVVLADISTELFEQAASRHQSRVINVGIREQALIGSTAGLALSGLRPIAHTYAPFLIERPFEQVKVDLGHQDLGAILVSVGATYDEPRYGYTHHAPGDVALIDTLPQWTVHVPGHPDEVDTLLRQAVADDNRVYIRLSTQTNHRPQSVGDGQFSVIRKGTGPTVVAVGPMLDRVLEATSDLDVTVLYAATVRPFDAATLRFVLAEPAVVLVEPYLRGTSSARVSEALVDLPHRLLALGAPPHTARRYGTPADHDAEYGLDPAGLRASISRFVAHESTFSTS
ncbi:transketolase family protein [Phytoactinopolyspora limicola]|uniref:transketolase family protein n=1 Tax=Phytoactinopolyspora limicola TaxID=2715536 RepID=UPI00140A564D|nr:transketolase C-terminal domain-containing protein [Phytoactinopolyspora limicola]